MFHNTTRKQIILVRHAKVIENEEYVNRDFDKPLSAEGERANYIVANYLRLIGIKPDRIVTSPAVRAKATALGIAKKFHITGVEESPLLYVGNPIAGRDAIAVHMDVVRKSKKDCNILMIVGHNNDLTDFAMHLSGETLPSMKK
jgi:phosphohistidine phosphatase